MPLLQTWLQTLPTAKFSSPHSQWGAPVKKQTAGVTEDRAPQEKTIDHLQHSWEDKTIHTFILCIHSYQTHGTIDFSLRQQNLSNAKPSRQPDNLDFSFFHKPQLIGWKLITFVKRICILLVWWIVFGSPLVCGSIKLVISFSIFSFFLSS